MVKGYKVFNPDWTCRDKQYTCPGKFEVYVHGMLFCQTASDCFNYYPFDNKNKVAEVIAYGEVQTDGRMSYTDKLEIVREIQWDEVLRIVNTGKIVLVFVILEIETLETETPEIITKGVITKETVISATVIQEAVISGTVTQEIVTSGTETSETGINPLLIPDVLIRKNRKLHYSTKCQI